MAETPVEVVELERKGPIWKIFRKYSHLWKGSGLPSLSSIHEREWIQPLWPSLEWERHCPFLKWCPISLFTVNTWGIWFSRANAHETPSFLQWVQCVIQKFSFFLLNIWSLTLVRRAVIFFPDRKLNCLFKYPGALWTHKPFIVSTCLTYREVTQSSHHALCLRCITHL